MQKPFDMSKMLENLDAEINVEESHDAVRTGTGTIFHSRGPVGVPDSGSLAPRSTDNPADDPINPSHYRKHPSGIECIEVTRHMNFNVGNAIKYLWRYQDKGDAIENLKKAQWYLDDEIRRLEGLR